MGLGCLFAIILIGGFLQQAFLVEFGLIIILAAALGIIAKLFRQPLILAYLVAGILIGPFVLGIVKERSVIETFGSIGIIFLLFLIGLELNPRRLLEVGKSVFTIAIIQILASGLIYYLVANRFGLDNIGAIYLALAFAFSSTAIIVTLLSSRGEMDSVHGRIIVGVLLIQDFIAILALTIFSGLQSTAMDGSHLSIYLATLVGKAIILFLATWLIAKYILPRAFSRIARSQELLFITSLAWCFCLVILAQKLGFSAEIGAFLAGVSLAPLPYSTHVAAKTKPLRDFFLMIFFISLGSNLVFANIASLLVPAIVFTALIVIVNPMIIMVTMGALGYRKRAGFLTGISLTQISEFSFIVVVLGVKLGVLPASASTLVSMVAIMTIFISTYLISNASIIYHWLRPVLGIIESSKSHETISNLPTLPEDHIVLIGCHRVGGVVLETLKDLSKKIVVVDYDPKRVNRLISEGQLCIYGDASDIDIIAHLNLKGASLVISTVNNIEESKAILANYRKINPKLKIILTAHDNQDAIELFDLKADLVIVPTSVAADYVSHLLEQIISNKVDITKIARQKMKELVPAD
jgi:Kef-type K+ transport system membrane component KefB